MNRHLFPIIALAALALSSAARADIVDIDKFSYDGTVNGIRNGKLSITLKSSFTELMFDLNQVVLIDLDVTPKLADAERARTDDAKKAAALYKQAIAAINKPDLKLLAEWRAIESTDKDGRWSEALALFLDVYQASPTESIWKGRPAHWPDGGSKMYADGIERMTAAIKAAKNDDVRKNLKTFLVEIYIKAGDNDAAGNLAKEIQTGIAPDPATAVPSVASSAAASVEELFQKKDYTGAINQAGLLLDAAPPGDSGARLYAIEAQSYEATGKLDDAAAAWLRIPAYYPSSALAPSALQRAADLQQKLKRPEAAMALLKEIVTAYPESKEAAALKPK